MRWFGFSFGFECDQSSSGFSFIVCILLLHVFRGVVLTYCSCLGACVSVSLLGLDWVAERPFLFCLVAVCS